MEGQEQEHEQVAQRRTWERMLGMVVRTNRDIRGKIAVELVESGRASSVACSAWQLDTFLVPFSLVRSAHCVAPRSYMWFLSDHLRGQLEQGNMLGHPVRYA